MKTFTVSDIRRFRPCYPPERHIAADAVFTLAEFAAMEYIPAPDRLWWLVRIIPDALGREMGDRVLRLFAVECARDALSHVASPDARIVALVDMAERFALGQVMRAELAAALKVALDAAPDNASTAVRGAAWDAAWYAALDVAWAAARATARAAASGAAQEAVSTAAWYDAWDAALDRYVRRLAEMAEEEMK